MSTSGEQREGAMVRSLRVVHYLNQFFGQIGGEDQAGTACQVKPGPVGPGLAFKALLGGQAEIVATVICGDNYMGENLEQTSLAAAELVAQHQPDLLLAGPAFVSGRYGMACGAVCQAVAQQLGIPTVTGMSEENPAVDIYKAHAYIAPAGKSAAKMKDAAQAMVKLALALAQGQEPEPGSYFAQGKRRLVVREASGAQRAVQMLVELLQGGEPATELPLPNFEKVPPAPALTNLAEAVIVLGTEGGVTPVDNPDRIEMSMATKWGRYSLEGLAAMDPERFTASHGGYDNTAAKQNPNRVVPLDVMCDLAGEGVVGSLAEFFYTTAGNATTVDNATRFGREIAQDIRARFQDKVGVVFTST